MSDDTPALIEQLLEARRRHCIPPRIRAATQALADDLLALLFPHFSSGVGREAYAACLTPGAIEAEIAAIEVELRRMAESLRPQYKDLEPAVAARFTAKLPEVHRLLRLDAEAIFQGDPAAQSVDEVILTYPGFYAIAVFRVAHALHQVGFPLIPRILTELAHQRTGVDIHPSARIGHRFVIDHGTGVVIGETTVIGNGVKLYQGVTLGALTVEKELAHLKRHPTLEDNVVVYSNATILGGDTVIGHDSIIGGNAWLTQSVLPFSAVSRRSEVRPRQPGDGADLEFMI